MPTPDGHRYLPSTAVFLVELLRLVVCVTIALYEISQSWPRTMPLTSMFGVLGHAVFAGDSWKIALPAGLYTLANSLQYVAISNLDAATFHVTYQFKIIVTAVLSVFMLNRSINARQWLSLVLLMIGVAIVSLPQDDQQPLASSHHTRVYLPRSLNPLKEHLGLSSPGSNLKKRSATYEGIEEDEMAMYSPIMDASIGLLAVFCVCICSGLAGVYFEKVIKEATIPTSMWIRNVQLSVYSMFPAFFIGVLFLDGETVARYGFFAGYNSVVVISVLVQTFGAVVAAFCMYYADNISKNFAVSISMVLSALASVLFFNFQATTHVSYTSPLGMMLADILQFVIGTAIVLVSTWIYTAQGSRTRPPIIKLNSEDEKSQFISPTAAKDASISIPKTPLSLEDTTITTSRPGSPAPHKKRKNEPVGYFTKSHH